MPRFAFSEPSIGSTTTRHGVAGAEDALAELLRDEREVLVELLEPVHDRRLGGRVDRGRVVAALAGGEHGLALDAGRQLGEHAAYVADRVAAHLEPRRSTAGGRAGR